MTGACPVQNPRTHRRIGSARGLLFLAPGRTLPPLNPATTGTSLSIPWGTGVKLGLPDGQICLCRNRSGPSVAIPKCQSVSIEKPRGFSWSLGSMVMMLEGWGMALPGGVPQRHFSQDQSCPFFYQKSWVPLTACIVLVFHVAALLALCPHSVQEHWAGFFVNSKKDGETGETGPTLASDPAASPSPLWTLKFPLGT